MSEAVDTLETCDSFSQARNMLRYIAVAGKEWAGIPMPIEGEDLIIEKSYPFAEALTTDKEADPTDFTPRNRFWSFSRNGEVFIWDEADGLKWGVSPATKRITMDMRTLGCSQAWGIEQEANAIKLLAGLLRHHNFKQYMLTGQFLERSKRSGLMYIFRRLKPTVALSSYGEQMRVLCALCMHPIAYYADTWAGAMCPTDDVIASLMMMRADEHRFWKMANQHPSHIPQAGL